MFYTFIQNNSGGSFIKDLETGIGYFVIIEANDYKEANNRAEEIGIYFNGVEKELDCECCGDRWSTQYKETDGKKTPMIYGKSYKEYEHWYSDKGNTGAIHYKDGRIELF